MDAASIFLGRKLLERIEENRDTLRQTIESSGVTDFGQYKFLAGQLLAMKMVLQWLEDISTEDTNDARTRSPDGSRRTTGGSDMAGGRLY